MWPTTYSQPGTFPQHLRYPGGSSAAWPQTRDSTQIMYSFDGKGRIKVATGALSLRLQHHGGQDMPNAKLCIPNGLVWEDDHP